jgi:beta-N-acetylhexosaminidase
MLAAHLTHGLALAGMANCGKHYPGHGWAIADSHVAVPHDERSRAELLARDAAPYRWLGPQLSAVMPAHVVYDRVDSAPAGASDTGLTAARGTGIRRRRIHDDLLMEEPHTRLDRRVRRPLCGRMTGAL